MRKEKLIKVIITETYAYEIDIEAKTQKEALAKAKEIYRDENMLFERYDFTADAISHIDTKFKISKEESSECRKRLGRYPDSDLDSIGETYDERD